MSQGSKKTVVLVGAGGAGALIARALSTKLGSKYNLVVVASRPFYLHLPSSLRALVVPDFGPLDKTVFFSYEHLFVDRNGKLVQGVVTGVEEAEKGGRVVLESGERISYDVLVVSPGCKWESGLNFPTDESQATTWVEEWRTRFRNANEVAIVGGGAVGIELAGELKDVYPNKPVSIVQADRLLLNDAYPDKFRIDLQRRLEARDVKVILGDRIDTIPEPPSHGVQTSSGKSITADLVVATRGGRPNTDFLKSLGSGVLTPSGLIKIQPTLQIQGHDHILAAGDAIDFPEQKQFGKYGGHATVIADNVFSLLEGQPAKKPYKGIFEAAFISIGKGGGAGYLAVLWGLTFGNWVTSTAKSKNLWVDMTRKSIGLTP